MVGLSVLHMHVYLVCTDQSIFVEVCLKEMSSLVFSHDSVTYVVLSAPPGRTGSKCCAANGTTGACQITPNLASVAVKDTLANATSGIPIVDASPSCLVANSRRWVMVAVAKPEQPPKQTGPCGRTHATPFPFSLNSRSRLDSLLPPTIPPPHPPNLNCFGCCEWLLLLLLLLVVQAHERRGWTLHASR